MFREIVSSWKKNKLETKRQPTTMKKKNIKKNRLKEKESDVEIKEMNEGETTVFNSLISLDQKIDKRFPGSEVDL